MTYVLTRVQIEALNALPPGLYLVCAACGEFREHNGEIAFDPDGPICGSCARWGRPASTVRSVGGP